MDVKLHSERIIARGRCRNVEDRAVSSSIHSDLFVSSPLPLLVLCHIETRKKLISRGREPDRYDSKIRFNVSLFSPASLSRPP